MENDTFVEEVTDADAAKRGAVENIFRTRIADIQWLMSSPRGRRIAWWLMESAGVSRTSYSRDALDMAFKEGGRNQGLMLQAQVIEHCPSRYIEMLNEQSQGKPQGK